MADPAKRRLGGFKDVFKTRRVDAQKTDAYPEWERKRNDEAREANAYTGDDYNGNKTANENVLTQKLCIDPRHSSDMRYWGHTRSIAPVHLEALMRRHSDEITEGMFDPKFKFHERIAGAFNCTYILESRFRDKICVRVPAFGWKERWNRIDAQMLRATALGMKLIRERSQLPVPELLAYDTTMENEIGAPYVIMSFLEGMPAGDMWKNNGEDACIVEARRQTLLRNIANTMCRLETTAFYESGTLWFPHTDDRMDPVVGNTWRLDTSDICTIQRKFVSLKSQRSVEGLLLAGKARLFEKYGYSGNDEVFDVYKRGVFRLWELMITAFVAVAILNPEEPEFVLMHPDFRPQDIIVDDDLNITGIIDWDCLEAVPRQVGWCSVPRWLQQDWDRRYRWPPDDEDQGHLMPDDFERYRRDYTTYMREACAAKADSRFTSKSHIYKTLLDSVSGFRHAESFVYNCLADILPRNAVSMRKHVGEIGEQGFRPGEKEWLDARLMRYFEPDPEPVF